MLSSPVDMVLVGAVALLLFGPKRLPELGRSLGQGLGNFKKALNEASDAITSNDTKTEIKANTDTKTDQEANS